MNCKLPPLFNSVTVELTEKPDRPHPGAPLRATGSRGKLFRQQSMAVGFRNYIF